MATPDTSSGTLYIDGKWRPAASGLTFPVTNPATSEVLAQISAAQTQDVRDAVDAAEAAFPAWAARTAYERAGYLYDAHRLMLERAEELARLMTTEQGKPLRTARNEVRYAADFLIWFAEEAKRVYGADDPVVPGRPALHGHAPAGRRGRGDHAVELPDLHDHPEGRPRRSPRAARSCSSRPSRRRCARWRCSGSCTRSGFPPAWSNLVTASRPGIGGRRAPGQPGRAQAHLHRLHRGRQAARRRARPRRSSGSRSSSAGTPRSSCSTTPTRRTPRRGAALVKFLNTGQACICPNRIFVHRSVADRFLEVLRRPGRPRCRPATASTRASPIGPLIDEGALAKMERAGDRRGRQGSERGARRRAPDRRAVRRRDASSRRPC